METEERPFTLEASPHLVLALVAAAMVVVLTVAGVVFTATSAGHSRSVATSTTISASPMIQVAEQSCQHAADAANTYGVIEPVAVAQIRDQAFGMCMADRGFPLPA